MDKKNKIFRSLTFLILIIAVCLTFGISSKSVSAFSGNVVITNTEGAGGTGDDLENLEEEPESPTQAEINKTFQVGYEILAGSDLEDRNLYHQLLKQVQALGYTGDTLYSKTFVNFETISIVDDMRIASLKGLELFKFDSLKNLVITNNNIASVSSTIFENMPKLRYVNFANNLIETCDLTSIISLDKVNLSSNKLEEIDLSNMNIASNLTVIDINIANNMIDDMSDIKLPTKGGSDIQLNILNNNILDISEEYFKMPRLKKFNVGVQGFNQEDDVDLDTLNGFRYYKTHIDGFSVEIYDINSEKKVLTFSDEDVLEGYYKNFSLPVGNYYYEIKLNGEKAYYKDDYRYAFYKGNDFNMLPIAPTYSFEFKNKKYDKLEGTVTGKVKVFLESQDGGKVYYKLSNGEWVEGTEILCEGGGNFFIQVKTVIGDYESKPVSILVKTSLNEYISDIFMLIIVLFITLVLFFVVLPIVRKKFFSN